MNKRSKSYDRKAHEYDDYDSNNSKRRRFYDQESRRKNNSPTFSSASNNSSQIDDSIGHFNGIAGDKINDRYIIINELGAGTFGKVYYCKDSKYNDYIALKVVRSISRYVDSAKIEADILSKVYNKQKEYNSNFCMKMFSHFDYNGGK